MRDPSSDSETLELTYPLRAAVRLTGLSPELLRAWERRHGVVTPVRTAGGTRRYRASDLERLRRIKGAVDAGHRISKVARLTDAELERFAGESNEELEAPVFKILATLGRLEGVELQRLLSAQLSTLGPIRFVRDIALPLVIEIGEQWADGRLSIASEHLATSVLRSLLGSALQPTRASLAGPRIVFATPAGEPHELGLLMAALTAQGAGANPLYLGAELPIDDLVHAVKESDASVLALGLVTLPAGQASHMVNELRERLGADVKLWLGGAGAADVTAPPGVERLASLEDLEERVVIHATPKDLPR